MCPDTLLRDPSSALPLPSLPSLILLSMLAASISYVASNCAAPSSSFLPTRSEAEADTPLSLSPMDDYPTPFGTTPVPSLDLYLPDPEPAYPLPLPLTWYVSAGLGRSTSILSPTSLGSPALGSALIPTTSTPTFLFPPLQCLFTPPTCLGSLFLPPSPFLIPPKPFRPKVFLPLSPPPLVASRSASPSLLSGSGPLPAPLIIPPSASLNPSPPTRPHPVESFPILPSDLYPRDLGYLPESSEASVKSISPLTEVSVERVDRDGNFQEQEPSEGHDSPISPSSAEDRAEVVDGTGSTRSRQE
ncbi:vegetative cell wall protein gp1-like [Amborella trichopoda]|uniref:vegetative cell wall protein gp1-like n=1 Tax=Amborella trichopoda TaxID=13333 RepID=UPI0005D34325|nr:vegetative cell wall protein gp1-like [Amborella trichopoda]|eukprot:XP_011625656.1 vegetative cell wall protein gp1-like [Amborella trichopoda]